MKLDEGFGEELNDSVLIITPFFALYQYERTNVKFVGMEMLEVQTSVRYAQ